MKNTRKTILLPFTDLDLKLSPAPTATEKEIERARFKSIPSTGVILWAGGGQREAEKGLKVTVTNLFEQFHIVSVRCTLSVC